VREGQSQPQIQNDVWTIVGAQAEELADDFAICSNFGELGESLKAELINDACSR